MANSIEDPRWQKLVPSDILERVQSVIGVKDANDDEPQWAIYLQLDQGERYSGVWTPSTNGYSSTVSAIPEMCESDLQRKKVAGRVGLVQVVTHVVTASRRTGRG